MSFQVREDIVDEERLIRPGTATTDENMEKVTRIGYKRQSEKVVDDVSISIVSFHNTFLV